MKVCMHVVTFYRKQFVVCVKSAFMFGVDQVIQKTHENDAIKTSEKHISINDALKKSRMTK